MVDSPNSELTKTVDRESPRAPYPWYALLATHSDFLNSLDCIYDMFKLVGPILESKDKERQHRIEEIGKEINDADGRVGRKLKSLEDVKEFMGHLRKMRTADRMFRQNIVVSVVSKFDEFLADLLREFYKANPNWLRNPSKTITYKELFEAESVDRLRSDLIQREVENLMRDSHHAQIAFIDEKLKLGLQEEFTGWTAFLEITERRNIFVHNGGCVNDAYLSNAKKLGFTPNSKARVGVLLDASDEYIRNTIDYCYELSVRVVQGAVRRLYPDGIEDADLALNNPTVNLLTEERWGLAERIFAYALGIPEKLRTPGEWYYFYLINYCISLKFAGKQIKDVLGRVQWKVFHPKYHFAVAVLEDRFDDAAKLMLTESVRKSIDREQFLGWPLFREFRKTDAFQNAFGDIYGQNEQIEILRKAESDLRAEQIVGHEAPEDASSDG
jgi:hypothetical protein